MKKLVTVELIPKIIRKAPNQKKSVIFTNMLLASMETDVWIFIHKKIALGL